MRSVCFFVVGLYLKRVLPLLIHVCYIDVIMECPVDFLLSLPGETKNKKFINPSITLSALFIFLKLFFQEKHKIRHNYYNDFKL